MATLSSERPKYNSFDKLMISAGIGGLIFGAVDGIITTKPAGTYNNAHLEAPKQAPSGRSIKAEFVDPGHQWVLGEAAGKIIAKQVTIR
jgi:hypothetical protein